MIAKPAAIAAGALLLLIAPLASSQELSPALARDQEGMSQEDLRSVQRLLDSREREFLYPTEERNPLDIVGIDQENNDFRAGTPALKNADMTVAMVDTEEARERLLSLYGGKQVIPAPLGLAAPGNSHADPSREDSPNADRKTDLNEGDESGDSEHSLPWFYSVPLLGLAAAWLWTRSRS